MALDYEGLIESYKHPVHRGVIKEAAHSSVSNLSCGDKLTLYLATSPAGVVTEAKYDGSGCVISMATAEVFCSYAKGKKLSVLCSLTYEKLTYLLGFKPSVGRVGCVMIVLDSLKGICEKNIKKTPLK